MAAMVDESVTAARKNSSSLPVSPLLLRRMNSQGGKAQSSSPSPGDPATDNRSSTGSDTDANVSYMAYVYSFVSYFFVIKTKH